MKMPSATARILRIAAMMPFFYVLSGEPVRNFITNRAVADWGSTQSDRWVAVRDTWDLLYIPNEWAEEPIPLYDNFMYRYSRLWQRKNPFKMHD